MKELFLERYSSRAFSLGILMLAGLFWTGTLKAQDVSGWRAGGNFGEQ